MLGVGSAFVGLPNSAIRKHGPVELRVCFLTLDPLVIPAELYVNEKTGVFVIQAFGHNGELGPRGKFQLKEVHAAVAQGGGNCHVKLWDEHGKPQPPCIMGISVSEKKFMIFMSGEKDSAPIWLNLGDVKKVL